jgi:antitoxin (DNA-binding transcriptional repressor) of toxin-antitoxin stability system
MKIVDIREARTQLSKLLGEIEGGIDVVLARAGKPVARIVRVGEPERRFGAIKGRATTGEAFFEDLPKDEVAAWE